MNVKVRAAVEVAVGLALVILVATGVQSLLTAAAAAYGALAVIDAIMFMVVGTAAYVIVGLAYDMRVAKLQYRAKLNEMVKK